jgi:hypothetical protein
VSVSVSVLIVIAFHCTRVMVVFVCRCADVNAAEASDCHGGRQEQDPR